MSEEVLPLLGRLGTSSDGEKGEVGGERGLHVMEVALRSNVEVFEEEGPSALDGGGRGRGVRSSESSGW